MKPFAIVADSTCDLPQSLRERFDIEIVLAHIMLPDKTEVNAETAWNFMPKADFYADLKKGAAYTTSPPSVGEFAQKFRALVQEGKDVLALCISSGISGTYQFMVQAKQMVEEEYPEAKIICIDSLRYSVLLGLMVVKASQLRTQGLSLDETAAWLENNKKRFHQMGFLDDLSYLAKRKRISNAAALGGTLIGIKPLGDIDEAGLTTVLGKAKGEKSAYQAILAYMEATAENIRDQIVFVATTNRDKQQAKLAEMIKEKFAPAEVILCDVYPMCGSNIGPGLLAAYYIGKPLSPGLEEEKALMTNILAQ